MKNPLSPSRAIGLAVLLFVLLTLGATAIGLSGRTIPLNETQIMYLFSTSSQVIAAIYGLTLTGFIFFRNELNREEAEDETLADAVETLKARYFVLLVFITVLVSVTLLLANLEIAYEASGEGRLNVLIINAGQSAFLVSLVSIAYFVFDVISPKRIERASKTLQSQVDPSVVGQATGDLEEFLKNYNEIEALLGKVGNDLQEARGGPFQQRGPRRLPNIRLADLLVRTRRIDRQLFHTLRELITLRNAIIHGAEPVVSQAMVETSREVLQKLRAALDRP